MTYACSIMAAVAVLCSAASSCTHSEGILITPQAGQPVTRIQGMLSGIREEALFIFHARAGQHLRVSISGENPIRGVVIYPSGKIEGGLSGTIFNETLTETGEYRIRVTESPMGEEWRGKFILEIELKDK